MMSVKNIKNIFWTIAVFVISTFPLHLLADHDATHRDTPTDPGSIGNPLKPEFSSIYAFVEEIVRIAGQIGFYIAIFFIVYSGFLFVKARGNDQELEKAKKTLTWTLVGTAVLLGAWIFALAIKTTINSLGIGG
jgi:hypothetical protein